MQQGEEQKLYKSLLITNNKGGVGKTLITFHIGYILATEFNKKVLFIDIDVQKSVMSILASHVKSKEKYKTIPDIFEEAYRKIDSGVDIDEYIHKTAFPNIDIIRTDDRVNTSSLTISALPNRDFAFSRWLKKNVSKLNEYDVVLFDNDSSFQEISKNIAMATDSIVLISSSDKESVSGIERYLKEFIYWTEAYENAHEKSRVIKGILLNDIKETTTVGRAMIDYVNSDDFQFKKYVFKSKIHHATVIEQCKFLGETFSKADNKRAYEELRAVIHELIERGVV